MKIIDKYFPELTAQQYKQLHELENLYLEWNSKINVISRKDIENLYIRHVLHSLAIIHIIRFTPHSRILDLGTGGGFPGIPLAILFPECDFLLIDGTRKKIKVVEAVAEALELHNVKAQHIRAEELKKQQFHFVVCRAVASIDKLFAWSSRLLGAEQQNALPNGLIALKGGNITAELKQLPRGTYYEKTPISDFFSEPEFENKWVVYVQG